jgi:hypothetical protein
MASTVKAKAKAFALHASLLAYAKIYDSSMYYMEGGSYGFCTKSLVNISIYFTTYRLLPAFI